MVAWRSGWRGWPYYYARMKRDFIAVIWFSFEIQIKMNCVANASNQRRERANNKSIFIHDSEKEHVFLATGSECLISFTWKISIEMLSILCRQSTKFNLHTAYCTTLQYTIYCLPSNTECSIIIFLFVSFVFVSSSILLMTARINWYKFSSDFIIIFSFFEYHNLSLKVKKIIIEKYFLSVKVENWNHSIVW